MEASRREVFQEWEDDVWTEVVTTHFDPPVVERKVEVAGPGVIFERESDRVNQRKIMAALCVLHPWMRSVEMPLLHHFDFEAWDTAADFLFALLEMKRRFVLSTFYPNIWLSKAKADRCVAEAMIRECEFNFVVGFNDGIRMARVYSPTSGRVEFPVEIRGRSGRVYPNGKPVVEPCYIIDRSHFVNP